MTTNATEQEYRIWATAELEALPKDAVLDRKDGALYWRRGTYWQSNVEHRRGDQIFTLMESSILAGRALRRIR